jgi:hypothetical protein
MRMKKLFTGFVFALFASGAVAGLDNGGFEGQTVDPWITFSAGLGASADLSTGQSRSGAQSLLLSIDNTDNTFAGVFQDITGFSAGDTVDFQGWHKTVSNPLDLTVEIRIEWRNAALDSEVGRTDNLLPSLGTDYSSWLLSGIVPANADVARVVYGIQTYTGGPTNNGAIHIDDLSVSAVPEPSSLLLMCLGGGLLLARRRAAQTR